MKKLSSSLLALFVAVAVSGCTDTVDVKDGRIPAELLSAAQLWTGTYSGRFDGITTDLKVAIDGDRPVVTTNRDLVGNQCNSRIGLLKSISHETNDAGTTVADLTFELDPGQCNIAGRTLTVSARMDGKKIAALRASFIKRHDFYQRCEWVGGGWVGDPHHGYPIPPTYNCWTEPYFVYASGTLARNPSLE